MTFPNVNSPMSFWGLKSDSNYVQSYNRLMLVFLPLLSHSVILFLTLSFSLFHPHTIFLFTLSLSLSLSRSLCGGFLWFPGSVLKRSFVSSPSSLRQDQASPMPLLSLSTSPSPLHLSSSLCSVVPVSSDLPCAGGGGGLRPFLRRLQPSGVSLRPGRGLHRRLPALTNHSSTSCFQFPLHLTSCNVL